VSTRKISDAELLQRVMSSRVADIHTSTPGRVVSYDAAKRTAEIAVLVKRMVPTQDGEPVEEPLPNLPNVPVLLFRAGGCTISLPVKEGDTGLLLFNHASPAEWRAKGGDSATAPKDLRMHHPAHAVFLPGWCPDDTETPASEVDGIVLDVDDGQHVVLGKHDAANYIPRADRLADAIANKVAAIFDAHKHTGVTTGPGTSGVPDTLMSPDLITAEDIACDRVKGE